MGAQRQLGSTQQAMLDSLRQHKRWSRGCGWIWDNNSITERLLESLVRRGLVTTHKEVVRGMEYTVYTPVKQKEE